MEPDDVEASDIKKLFFGSLAKKIETDIWRRDAADGRGLARHVRSADYRTDVRPDGTSGEAFAIGGTASAGQEPLYLQ